MTSNHQTPAFRTSRLGLVMTMACALLAMATPADASLPVALPATEHHVATAIGTIDASASQKGASGCADLRTPAVPSLPSIPALPVPVAVPAVPTEAADARADACATAGLDGVSVDGGFEAAGSQMRTGIEASSPVSQDEVHTLAGETTEQAEGFFEGLFDRLFGWM